jgi:hypothetical protein
MCIYIYIYIYLYTNKFIYTHTHAHTCIHTHIHAYINVYIHTYIPTYIYTYILHTWTHTYTYILRELLVCGAGVPDRAPSGGAYRRGGIRWLDEASWDPLRDTQRHRNEAILAQPFSSVSKYYVHELLLAQSQG